MVVELMMGTPWVGRCTRAQGVGRACARGRQTCFEKEKSDLFRVTTNLILFRETGVLDRELNLASIPYMGSPEGLRHCYIISVRPSKQPLMVRTFLKIYMELGSYFLFLQEQIKDIIIII